jgi:hypothetical protein
MGLSFHDETSLVKVAESALRFASDGPISISETESIVQDGGLRFAPDHLSLITRVGRVNQERKNNDIDGSEDTG